MTRIITIRTVMVACAIFAALSLVVPGNALARSPDQDTTAIVMFTDTSVPSISLIPTSGSVGTRVLISGGNFAANDTNCVVSSKPSPVVEAPSCSVLEGAITASFTVAANATTGSYYVLVTSNPSQDTASASFTVLPTIPASTATTTTTTTATTASVASTTMQTSASPLRPPRCIIATVTFGSEASPAVQFLRDFRDDLVASTRAGSAFMEVFNAWYYSFSPSVAEFIAGHDPIRAPLRAALYPLLGALGVSALAYSAFSSVPEFAIVVAGIAASSLIGLVYLTGPALIGLKVLARRRRIAVGRLSKSALAAFAMALALLAAGEAAGSFVLLALASSALVLICITAAPLMAALLTIRPRRR